MYKQIIFGLLVGLFGSHSQAATMNEIVETFSQPESRAIQGGTWAWSVTDELKSVKWKGPVKKASTSNFKTSGSFKRQREGVVKFTTAIKDHKEVKFKITAFGDQDAVTQIFLETDVANLDHLLDTSPETFGRMFKPPVKISIVRPACEHGHGRVDFYRLQSSKSYDIYVMAEVGYGTQEGGTTFTFEYKPILKSDSCLDEADTSTASGNGQTMATPQHYAQPQNATPRYSPADIQVIQNACAQQANRQSVCVACLTKANPPRNNTELGNCMNASQMRQAFRGLKKLFSSNTQPEPQQ